MVVLESILHVWPMFVFNLYMWQNINIIKKGLNTFMKHYILDYVTQVVWTTWKKI